MFHKKTYYQSASSVTAGAIRALLIGDVPAIMKIQRACYGDEFMEAASIFNSRLTSSGHCSLAACINGELVAYLAAYWSSPGYITPLHGDFQNHKQPSLLYLHDMAVLPEFAGHGLARRLLQAVRAMATERGIRASALVSVQDSSAYWQRQGYQVHQPEDSVQLQHLASYGPDAVYMLGKI